LNSRKSFVNLSITLLMLCLFVFGCTLGGSNTNNTTSSSSNQSSTRNSPSPTTNVSPSSAPSRVSGNTTWLQTAVTYRGRNGQQLNFACSPNGQLRPVWGTDVYSDDSSICSAAVHAGVITVAQGGPVTIEIRPGQSSYAGSQRNGVTTSSYGSWTGSFVIISQ
jgi:hypothetical protein